MASPTSVEPTRASLELADWRRRVADLYRDVRDIARADPREAWNHWQAVRDRLYREHPQSPVPAEARAAFHGRYWPYDPRFRFSVEVAPADVARPAAPAAAPADVAVPAAPAAAPADVAVPAVPAAAPSAPTLNLPMSTGDPLAFTRIGTITVPLPGGSRTLGLLWMAGYAGGLFLPFRDATNGAATYGAGRYLLDTAKGADLGSTDAGSTDIGAGSPTGHLVIDFNFAFQPSCAFDPQWSCPLAPPENRLDLAIEAGERIA